jgi:hypothetical protein
VSGDCTVPIRHRASSAFASAAYDADLDQELEESPVLPLGDDLAVGDLMHQDGRQIDRSPCRRHRFDISSQERLAEVPEDGRAGVRTGDAQLGHDSSALAGGRERLEPDVRHAGEVHLVRGEQVLRVASLWPAWTARQGISGVPDSGLCPAACGRQERHERSPPARSS